MFVLKLLQETDKTQAKHEAELTLIPAVLTVQCPKDGYC